MPDCEHESTQWVNGSIGLDLLTCLDCKEVIDEDYDPHAKEELEAEREKDGFGRRA